MAMTREEEEQKRSSSSSTTSVEQRKSRIPIRPVDTQSSIPTSTLIDNFISSLEHDSSFNNPIPIPTSSTPIHPRKSHSKRPLSPPPTTATTRSSLDLLSIPSPSSTRHNSFNKSVSSTRNNPVGQSVRNSIASSHSSSSIRSKRISQPVFLGASNGLNPVHQDGNGNGSERGDHRDRALSSTLEESSSTGFDFGFKHEPLLPTSTSTYPHKTSHHSISTPTKSNLNLMIDSSNIKSIQRNDSIALKSKFSVSPDTRSKRSRMRAHKEKERINRIKENKNGFNVQIGMKENLGRGEIESNSKNGHGRGTKGELALGLGEGEGEGEGAKIRKLQPSNGMQSISRTIEPSLSLRGNHGPATSSESQVEDERFAARSGGATSPLSFSFKESSSTLGAGIQSLKTRM